MLNFKTDVGKKLTKVGEKAKKAMDVFNEAIDDLVAANEEYEKVSNEAQEEISRLEEVKETAKTNMNANKKVISNIKALLGN